jgi:NAD(P)-dependent dehydrogenase (short-subunit alcohol dehydrogenase family)
VKLAGRRVLVTGGGRGIGRAIVEACVAEGADVMTLGRTRADLERLTVEVDGKVRWCCADVTHRPDVDDLPRRVRGELGGLDVLVNNAGVWMEKPFLEYTREDWDRTLATNLTSVFDVTQALLPLLLESASARVVNLGAIDGEVGFAKLVAQCASKAGVIGLTRALAKELWDRPITVNAVCPAEVDKDVAYEQTESRVPAPARALPWDVARAVVYLASDEGVRVNGACLDVHGVGFLAS